VTETNTAKTFDVAIVGGGVIGAMTALELAEQGASVVVLERGAELAWGCSAGNAGIVGASHVTPLATPAAVRDGIRWMLRPDSPFFVRPRLGVIPWLTRFVASATPAQVQRSAATLQAMATRSAQRHAELDRAGLDAGYHQGGLLDVFRSQPAFDTARADAAAGEALTATEVATLAPQLGGGDVVGGVFHREEAHCDPLRFVLAVGAWAAALGVSVRTRTEVLGVRRHGERISALQTTQGELLVDEVVLAAGVWSGQLARELDLALPLEGGKGYHVDVEAQLGDPSFPIWLHEHRVVITPNGPRTRLAGTLELTGTDQSIDPRRVDAIVDAATHALPALASRPRLHVWRGLRPCTPDGLPVIGRAPGADNVTIATGHGMWGLQLAPITAELVASIIREQPSAVDLSPLRADRFDPPWRHVTAARVREVARA
jgi:D-amino-acid dehydrogenase